MVVTVIWQISCPPIMAENARNRLEYYEKCELTRYADHKRPNNSHGKQLIDLCKTSGLLIANGLGTKNLYSAAAGDQNFSKNMYNNWYKASKLLALPSKIKKEEFWKIAIKQ